MRRLFWALLAVALIAGTQYWTATKLSHEESDRQAMAQGPETAGIVQRAADPLALADTKQTVAVRPPSIDLRNPILPGKTLTLLDELGRPIDGAVVSVTELPKVGQQLPPAGVLAHDGRDGTLWAVADFAGRVTLQANATSSGTVVLWTSAPGFLSTPFISRSGLDDLPVSIVMVSREARNVLVVDANGDGIQGIRTVQVARPDPARNSDMVKAVNAYYRVFETDARGMVKLPPFPTHDSVQAFGDLRCSAAASDGIADVRLVLRSSFQASGLVTIDPEIDNKGVPLTVRYGTEDGVEIGVVAAPSEGSWGPVQIPLTDSARFWFKLDGGWVLPNKAWVGAPNPGQDLRVDLVGEKGEALWFKVYGDNNELLADASVEVQWEGPDGAESTTMSPREDDHLWVGGCKPGPVTYLASAPGYAPTSGGPIVVPEASPVVWQIQLYRKGVIHGHCTKNGAPVENFEVIFWQSLNAGGRQSRSFIDRKDGSFEITGVEVGHVRLLAVNKDSGPAEPVSVRVTANDPCDVTLELVDTFRGHGRVLDLDQLTPILDVKIKLYTTGDGYPFQAWGSSVTAGHDGTFEIDGISTAHQLIGVTATGYAGKWVTAEGHEEQLVDLGDTFLQRTQPVTLHLPASGLGDRTKVTVQCVPAGMAVKAFSDDGVAKYDGIGPGTYNLRIVDGEGGTQWVSIVLESGHVWDLELPLYGERTLDLTVMPTDGEELPPDIQVELSYMADAREGTRREFVPENGHLVLTGLPANVMSLSIVGLERHRIYANSEIDFAGQSFLEHRQILISGAQGFQVVDRQEHPVPSIDVEFYVRGGSSSGMVLVTNSAGRVEASDFHSQFRWALIRDIARGVMAAIPLPQLRDSEEKIVLTFDPDTPLRVRYVDGTEPAIGVLSRLSVEGHPSSVALPQHSDSNGYLEWPRLNRTEFIVTSSSLRYWPTTSVLTPDASTVHEVQVRGLGDLEVKVTGSMGEVLVGALVELRSVEFETGVAEWVADGRVQVSTSNLRTDGSGAIGFSELPRGRYAARVVATDGRAWVGEIEITAGELKRAAVMVP